MARPSRMTDETLRKLEQAFLMGCPDTEACLYADIAPSTLYKYAAENEEFSERKETLKQNPFMKARKIQMDDLNDGSSAIAQKVLERKEGSKINVSGNVGVTVNIEGKDAEV